MKKYISMTVKNALVFTAGVASGAAAMNMVDGMIFPAPKPVINFKLAGK